VNDTITIHGEHPDEVEQKLIKALYSMGFEKKPAKSEPLEYESLFSHSLNSYSVLKVLLDQISNELGIHEEDRKRILVAALLHDFGKEKIELGKESHKLAQDEFKTLCEKLIEFVPEMKTEDLNKIYSIYIASQGHHGEITGKEALKAEKGSIYALSLVKTADWLSSIDRPDSYIPFESLPWNPKNLLDFEYYVFDNIRGLLTLKLHKVINRVFTENGLIPIAYFPNGTLYIVKKGRKIEHLENKIRENILNEIRQVLSEPEIWQASLGYNPRAALVGLKDFLCSFNLDAVFKAAENLLIETYGEARPRSSSENAKNWNVKFVQEVVFDSSLKNTMKIKVKKDELKNKVLEIYEEKIGKITNKNELFSQVIGEVREHIKAMIDEAKLEKETEKLIKYIWSELSQEIRLSFAEIKKEIEPPKSNDFKDRCAICHNTSKVEALASLVGQGAQKFSDFNKTLTLVNANICYSCAIESALQNKAKQDIGVPTNTEFIQLYIFPERFFSEDLKRHVINLLDSYFAELAEIDFDRVNAGEIIEKLRSKFYKSNITLRIPVLQLQKRSRFLESSNYCILFSSQNEFIRLVSRRERSSAEVLEASLGTFYSAVYLYALAPVTKVATSLYAVYPVECGPFKLKEKGNIEKICDAFDTMRNITFQTDSRTILKPLEVYTQHGRNSRYPQALFLRRYIQNKGTLTNQFVFLVSKLGGNEMVTISAQTGVRTIDRPVELERLDKLGWFLAKSFKELGVIERGTRYAYTKPITLLKDEIRKRGIAGTKTFASKLINMAMHEGSEQMRGKKEIITEKADTIAKRLEREYNELGAREFKNLINALFDSFLYYASVEIHRGGSNDQDG
jgi:hypothetical protein